MNEVVTKREKKAAELLRHLLGEQQYLRYRFEKFIDVPSKLYPNTFYRIKPNGGGVLVLLSVEKSDTCMYPQDYAGYGPVYDILGNVYLVQAGMCVATDKEFPEDDGTAAIYLLAKHQEELLREQANMIGETRDWRVLRNA